MYIEISHYQTGKEIKSEIIIIKDNRRIQGDTHDRTI